MKLYLTTIGIAMVVISLINIGFDTAAWHYVIISVIWCTALQFVIDGGIAILINKMPNGWFGVDSPHYRVSRWERELYRRLGVRRWKDKVWELGGLGGFSKAKLTEPDNPVYIARFIIECNKGVITHRLSYFAGFLAMLTLPNVCAFTVALPVGVVNLFLNILPTIALRYNTPMLQSVLRGLKRHKNHNI